MKIIHITDSGLDSPNGTNRLIIDMAKYFTLLGHDYTLVQSHTTGTYPDVPDELSKNEMFHSITIKKKNAKRKNFVKRYLNSLVYEINAKKKWKKIIKSTDLVLIQSHYTAWLTTFLLRKYSCKLVFNIFDIFPGDAYENGGIKSKFVYNVFQKFQNYIYKKCDLIFTLTEDTKATLLNLGVSKNKIKIIPNWVDLNSLKEKNTKENIFIEKYKLRTDKKVVQYAGSIGISYDYDFLLDVAEKLSDRTDIIMQIVGEGLFLEDFKNKTFSRKLKNIQFIPWQPEEMLSDVYSYANIEIIPLKKGVIGNSYPSKILPLMACGRVPVISVEDESYFYKDINDSHVGLASNLGDVESMVKNIFYLIDNPVVLNAYQENAKRFVKERYNAVDNVKEMLDNFNAIIKKEGNK